MLDRPQTSDQDQDLKLRDFQAGQNQDVRELIFYLMLRCRHELFGSMSNVQWSSRTPRTFNFRLHAQPNRYNYYQVLQVDETAEQEEIRAAFRRLAKQLHPDVNNSSDADKQFRLLKRAHDILMDSQLRSVHDAELNLPSAEQKDPRFARFYRWRSEVLPDLQEILDEWSAEVQQIIDEAEATLSAQQQLLQLVVSLQQIGQRSEKCTTHDSAGHAKAAAGAKVAATAEAAPGAVTYAQGLLQVTSAEVAYQSQQEQQQQWLQEVSEMSHCQQYELMGALLSSMRGQVQDAAANIRRLYDKRYQQVEARYAYPAIVWYDLFTEVTDEWLNMAEALQARWHTAISSADVAVGGSRPVAAAGSVESQ